MAGIAPVSRSRVRPLRSFVKRRVDEESYLQLDWSRGTAVNLHHVLYKIVTETDSPKACKLSNLNCFAKICSRITSDFDVDGLVFLPEEFFCCLRVALLDEAYDVRAAGLRAMRYFIVNPTIGRAFLDSNQVHLVIRSLDINLDNKVERLQALRLLRHLIAVVPSEFPLSGARALVAIARDGSQESDILTRPCCAAIAELCLRNVSLAASAGCFSTLLDSIVQISLPRAMCESLIGTILFTLNHPVLRHCMRQERDLQIFVAPFTDCYNNMQNQRMEDNVETNEHRQMKFTAAKRAILTILRSWPGLIYFCRYTCDSSQGSNAIQSLIETLHMPYEETRRNILDLLFELLDLRQPSNLSESEQFSFEVLSSYHFWSGQDSWQIYDGFVAAEGRSLLPHVSRCRINLFDNYLSMMLYILVSYGVVEALVQVIITSKTTMFTNSIRATILLAEILHLSSRLLPHEVYRKCHALPDLVNAATCSSHSMEVRGIASTAIAALHRIHVMRRTSVVPFSLYLDQVMRFADLSSPPHLSDMKSRLQLKSSIAHEAEDITATYVRDSNVLSHDHRSYNWNLISSVLMWPTEEFKRLEDPSYRTFIKRLVQFFKPSSRMFSQMDVNDENSREIAMVACHFVDFLLEIDDARSSEFLGDFLKDVGESLSQITAENPQSLMSPNTVFTSTKLMTTSSHYYFLVIGRMTSSNKGSKWLESLGFYQHFSLMVASTNNDIFHKLIISSMDYTKEGFSRKILSKSLTAGSESCRLYATDFMLVLLRTRIPEFHKWALPLLVQQLYDESDSVSLAAAAILLESCDLKQNLQSLISLKPSLMHLKHIGLMLQIRFVSLPIGIRFLTESRMLDSLLMEWRRTHNLKYVHIVEEAMNEALTLHVKSKSGTYGSRSSDKKSIERNTFLPPHLYGQLAATEIGMKLLTSDDCIVSLMRTIRNQDLSNERKMLEMKASLWSVGHIMSTPIGLSYVTESDPEIMSVIAKMTTDCSILSVRGTCFYVLSMIAMTEKGVHQLDHMGWQGLTHARDEVWPLEDMAQDHQNLFQCFRPRKNNNGSESSGTISRMQEEGKQDSGKGRDNNSFYSPTLGDETRSHTSSADPNFTVKSLPAHDGKLYTESNYVKDKVPDFHAEVRCPFDGQGVMFEAKGRSSSCNNDATIVSSGISLGYYGGSSASGKSFPKLSPIASISAANHLSTSHSCYSTYHPLMPVMSASSIDGAIACNSDRDGDQIHSHHQPFETQPSSADAQGYATLRAINRRRVHSMAIQSSDAPSAILSDRPSPPASSCSSSHSDAYDENDLFSNDYTLNSSLTLPAGFMSMAQTPSQPPTPETFVPEAKVFIGVVIPISLSLLLEPPVAGEHVFSQPRDVKSSASDGLLSPGCVNVTDDALELHSSTNCILCYRVQVSGRQNDGNDHHPPFVAYTDSEGEDSLLTPGKTMSSNRNSLQPETLKHIVSASSITSASSAAETDGVASDLDVARPLIRKEVMRFVTNLSGSVAAKAAEQGMLNLKQRFPRAFQEDICLYSEVCQQLATYNFRLSARKFLQEIFQDINYDQLRMYAKEIIGRKANSSFREQDDESSEDRSTVVHE